MTDDIITLWTAQRTIVLNALDKDGAYTVKRDFVDQKYGETSWIFREAYSFFRREGSKLAAVPDDAESAIWLYGDMRWAAMSADTPMLRVDAPRDQVITFDLRLWSRILNLEYIGRDQNDEDAFAASLARAGLHDTLPVFQTPFYPIQKRQIIKSWERLFTSPAPHEYLQAGMWQLRREWISEIIYPKEL